MQDKEELDLPVVRCPRCGVVMRSMSTESAPLNQTKVAYRCLECGSEAERFIRRPPRKKE